MVIEKICKMSVKGVKLKSESFFLVSPAVFGVMQENLRGGADSAPSMDRVKGKIILGDPAPLSVAKGGDK